MPSAADVLSVRASFELAVFFVTWVAIVLLAAIVVHLHLRLQLLERRTLAPDRPVPYGHLVGRRIADLLGRAGETRLPRFVVFVSSPCPSCARILEELAEPIWQAPTALVWTGSPPSPPPSLPPHVRTVDDGPRISTELGIQATPFVLVVGPDGVIEQGMPVNSLGPLRHEAGAPASAAKVLRPGSAFKEVTP